MQPNSAPATAQAAAFLSFAIPARREFRTSSRT